MDTDWVRIGNAHNWMDKVDEIKEALKIKDATERMRKVNEIIKKYNGEKDNDPKDKPLKG